MPYFVSVIIPNYNHAPFLDERLSSVTANKSISERGMNHQQRKDNVDRIAACVILDTYLRMKGN